jgi:hypothetical protein
MNIYETSLLSADSGFDLKDQTEPVKLPKADIYKIKYEDKYSRQLLAAGETDKVVRTLKKAGYKIIIED